MSRRVTIDDRNIVHIIYEYQKHTFWGGTRTTIQEELFVFDGNSSELRKISPEVAETTSGSFAEIPRGYKISRFGNWLEVDRLHRSPPVKINKKGVFCPDGFVIDIGWGGTGTTKGSVKLKPEQLYPKLDDVPRPITGGYYQDNRFEIAGNGDVILKSNAPRFYPTRLDSLSEDDIASARDAEKEAAKEHFRELLKPWRQATA